MSATISSIRKTTRWWGELTLVEYKQVKDGGGYIIELEDG